MSMRQNNTKDRIALGIAVVIRWLADYIALIIGVVISASILYIAVGAFVSDPMTAFLGTLAIIVVMALIATSLWAIGVVAEQNAWKEESP